VAGFFNCRKFLITFFIKRKILGHFRNADLKAVTQKKKRKEKKNTSEALIKNSRVPVAETLPSNEIQYSFSILNF